MRPTAEFFSIYVVCMHFHAVLQPQGGGGGGGGAWILGITFTLEWLISSSNL